jgi:VanZ family protein
MKKMLLIATLLFTLFIVAIVIGADAGQFPPLIKRFYDFPGGDKAGHFILFGILSFLLNKSALTLFPKRNPARLILTVSLLLAILIGLEEWSQALFPTRTMSASDLMASYAGVIIFAVLVLWSRR